MDMTSDCMRLSCVDSRYEIGPLCAMGKLSAVDQERFVSTSISVDTTSCRKHPANSKYIRLVLSCKSTVAA